MRIDALVGLVSRQAAKSENAPNALASDARAIANERAVQPATAEPAVEAASSVEAAARQIETYLKSVGRTLEFRVDAETHRTVVTVRDADTGDVIRQIPGDEVLTLARHLHSLGGSVDLKV